MATMMARKAPASPALILTAISLSYFMVILDVQIVNVALPTMQRELGATVSGLQWVVDGYALVFAAFLLTAGALGDRLGAKRVFLVGLGAFTLASLSCGLAPSLITLEIFRAVQGIGAAILVPGSLTLLSHAFGEARQRAKAIGLWGGMGGLASVTGPIVGGFLTGTVGWRSVFFVNVPAGAIAVALTLAVVPGAPRQPGRGLDVPGQAVGIVALALLTFACIEGGVLGWLAPVIIAAFVGSVVLLGLFIIRERRAASPMLPLRFFSSASFSVANAVGFLTNFGFYGQLFLLSLYFQLIRGYSPVLTGIALLPEMAMVALAAILSGRIAAHTGPRLPMLIGQATGVVGLLGLIIASRDTSNLLLCVMLVLVGFGMAFNMPAMTVAIVEAVPRSYTGVASAVLNAARLVGSVLGVAMLGALLSQRSTFLPGMHIALGIACASFLAGFLVTLWGMQRPRERHERPRFAHVLPEDSSLDRERLARSREA